MARNYAIAGPRKFLSNSDYFAASSFALSQIEAISIKTMRV